MDAERWQRLDALFCRAMEIEDVRDRDSFLRDATDDAELRRDAFDLLAACRASDGFLESPALPTTLPHHTDTWIGKQIGPWRIEAVLGQGGMGLVLSATRLGTDFEQQVAVKVIDRVGSTEMAERFARERRILARLEHPGIARLLDGGTTDDGVPFLVMERVDGLPIDRYCSREHLGLQARIDLFLEVCQAVQAAHQSLIVHRDLKPANILITADGRPKLLDFGIAKLLEAETEDATECTRQGQSPATLGYASPEQLYGEPVDVACDLYSLGVILYELIGGERPRAVTSLRPEALAQAFAAEPPPVSRLQGSGSVLTTRSARRLATDLDAITSKALAADRNLRYPSVDSLADDLRRFLAGRPVYARHPTAAYRLRKAWQRHRLAASLSALAILALATVTLFSWRQAAALEVQRDAAEYRGASARASARFLADILRFADPEAGGGRGVSVRDAVDRAAREMPKGPARNPRIHAGLLHFVGSIYRGLGVPGSARPLLLNALELRRQALDRDDIQVIETLLELCRLETLNGTQIDAEQWCRQALDAARLQSDKRVEVLVSDQLTRVLVRQWRLTEALDLLRSVQGLVEASQPNAEAQRRGLRAHEARLLARLDRFAEARAIAAELLPYAADSPSLLSALGEISWLAGDPLGADFLWRRQLALVEARFGEKSLQTLAPRNDLALTLYDRDDPAGAAGLLAAAYEDAKELPGPGAHIAETIRINQAEITLAGSAEDAARLVDDITQNLSEEEADEDASASPDLWMIQGRIHLAQGDPNGARRLFERTLAARLRRLPMQHSLVLETRCHLASSLIALGDPRGGTMLATALGDLGRVLGQTHPRVRRIRLQTG